MGPFWGLSVLLLEKTEMVRRDMSWLVTYNHETQDMKISYPSKGIFNYALSICLEQKLEDLAKNATTNDVLAFFAKPTSKKQTTAGK